MPKSAKIAIAIFQYALKIFNGWERKIWGWNLNFIQIQMYDFGTFGLKISLGKISSVDSFRKVPKSLSPKVTSPNSIPNICTCMPFKYGENGEY
jgi:hypothetical protein